MIEIYEQGLSFDHARWEGGPGRCVMIEFGDADVQAMTHGRLQSLRYRDHAWAWNGASSGGLATLPA